jgi:D-alanine-D-alanine ligase
MKNGKFYTGKNLTKIDNYLSFSQKVFHEITFCGGKMVFSDFCRKSLRVDCAVICNHGGSGENGALCGFFETVKIPYTAAGVYQSALFMDKVFTKNFFDAKNIPNVPYRIYAGEKNYGTVEELGYPVIVKPANLGSSVGISVAKNRDELIAAVGFALRFDKKLLVEKALTDFTELNCAAYVKNGDIIVSEIEKPLFKTNYFDFQSKYTDKNGTGRELPADIDDNLAGEVKRLTRVVYEESGLSGVVRVDFLYADGRLYVNEVNTVPGSLAFYLFKNNGVGLNRLVSDMIAEAENNYMEKSKLVCDFASDVLKNFNSEKMCVGVKK